MNQTQSSIRQLIEYKKDQYRDTLRKNDLKQIFEEKRAQFQQNSQDRIIQSNSITKNVIIKHYQIESEIDQKEDLLIRLTKLKSQKNLTCNYLHQIIEYLGKKHSLYQISRIFNFCEKALLQKELINSSMVHLLLEIIFKIIQYKNEIPFKPIPFLLNVFILHQDYVILQYIQMYLQQNEQEKIEIDNFLKSKNHNEEQNILNVISSNKKYANFEMMLFLCKIINNSNFFQAIHYYGAQKLCEENIDKKEYKKTIQQIFKITGWQSEKNDFGF
ncbi:unnamed protein product [Paramecium sonneborni]|uniref:Uncharacterized protein n=1 Tax=Paramecium sonneborni TaxID=65129 RepID=A0A8S1K5L4_9CILI|nr:unnamed protein product [Paramecium sonneborni]